MLYVIGRLHYKYYRTVKNVNTNWYVRCGRTYFFVLVNPLSTLTIGGGWGLVVDEFWVRICGEGSVCVSVDGVGSEWCLVLTILKGKSLGLLLRLGGVCYMLCFSGFLVMESRRKSPTSWAMKTMSRIRRGRWKKNCKSGMEARRK